MSNNYPVIINSSKISLTTLESKLDILGHWLLLKSSKTRSSYTYEMTSFFKFIGNYSDLKDIKTLEISKYLSHRKESGASNATLAKAKSALSSFFNYLEKLDFINKNPVRAIDKIKVDNKTSRRMLSTTQIEYMIEKEPNLRNKLIITTFIKTGIRLFELCSLRYNSLLKRDEKYVMIIIGKGNKTRSFEVPQGLYDSLMSLKVTSDKKEPIFKKQKSLEVKPLTSGAVSKIIKVAAARIGLAEDVSPHWLRHSFGSYAFENGIDIKTIQHILGHDSLSTTDRYTHHINTPSVVF